MKTKILSLAMMSFWSLSSVFAQDRTTVTANNSDISDNLDLRAVASIFGDSRDLSDFESRLNDPNAQISNLDLNGDNRVDYLRVIETVEGNVHLIIIQSVLGRDNYQDIATVEVERDRYNRVQVQVVGDVYMYGNNYIYEPVYAYTPVIYTSFWVGNYRPYYSSWYWGYYPSFYVAWSPFPIYTYHNHIGTYINFNHHYNYVDYRRCDVAYNNYYNGRRGNYYETQYPNLSFSNRNTGYVNRYELDNNRRTQNISTRNQIETNGTRNNLNATDSPRIAATQNSSRSESSTISYGYQTIQESPRNITTPNNPRSESSTRSYGNDRGQESPRNVTTQNNPRSESSTRSYGNQRTTESPSAYGSNTVSELPRTYGNQRSQESSRSVATQNGSRSESSLGSYGNPRVQESQRNSSPREFSQQRGNSQRSEGNSRGNRRS
ncbi:hypothetical protein [Flavobacterium sp.]|uniref:hypothetical protein n=1 Tax=Flavobacterium sp. TaxID=239 RepID=UPI00286B56E1|nr:hypothetical protein [Flavobacterium sp.]